MKTIYDEIKRNEEKRTIVNDKNEQKKAQTIQKNKCFGEFDPGSGLTLAACLIHASRMVAIPWRTGE